MAVSNWIVQKGVGSTFSIYLPTDESAFAPEELQKANPDRQQEDVLSTNTGDMYAIDTEKEIIAEEKSLMPIIPPYSLKRKS